MKVYEIMSSNVITINQDSTILDAMKLMKKHNISFLIITLDDKILGSISEHDIFLNLTKELSTSTSIGKIMKKYVLTIGEDDDIIEASDLMARCLTTKLAVIDNDRNLVGVLTLSDIAKNEMTEEYALDALIEISSNTRSNSLGFIIRCKLSLNIFSNSSSFIFASLL
jgi:CBS domain-containing protein